MLLNILMLKVFRSFITVEAAEANICTVAYHRRTQKSVSLSHHLPEIPFIDSRFAGMPLKVLVWLANLHTGMPHQEPLWEVFSLVK